MNNFLEGLFDPSKPLTKIKNITATVDGRMATLSIESDDEDDLDENPNDYIRQIQQREEEEALALSSVPDVERNDMLDLEDFSSIVASTTTQNINFDHFLDVYKNYNFSYNDQLDLPINHYKEKLIRLIDTNQVLLLQGPTGCGKTTQLPQFILDYNRSLNKHCKIIVTQPRRIAAVSIARRVAEQRKWALGTVVGYQVGLHKEVSDHTLITYVTTGVLLQKLIGQGNMNDYTHIILDEVHERECDMDFLMLLVRKFSRDNSRFVKIILMSATFDASKFSHYFSIPLFTRPCLNGQMLTNKSLQPAPIETIARKTKHNIHIYFLDDIKQLGPFPEVDFSKPAIDINFFEICALLISKLERLDQEAIPGSALIFLPGIHEIEELHSTLQKPKYHGTIEFDIIPLHSTITNDEQRKVFMNPRPNRRKIVLSTNIAESSITVPDIKYIIDFCRTKEIVYDPKSTFSSLQLTWASKTQCTQRAGRVGRVSDGRVYRLIPEKFYENYIPIDISPEMKRVPLEQLVLHSKRLNLDLAPHEILGLALDPPDLNQISRTILVLKELGGLLLTHKGTYSPLNGDLTFFGHVMATLPLDVRLAKLIVLGHIFGCLEDCIIMAAGVSCQKLFSTPFKEVLNAYSAKLSWADGCCSDLIAILNVYKVWQYNFRQKFTTNPKTLEQAAKWGKRSFIQYKVLLEIESLITEIKSRLKVFNITEMNSFNSNDFEKSLILKVVICGAFYPNYFVRKSNQIDEREAVKILNGRTPNNTVYFQGMNPSQPGELYTEAIKGKMKSCGNNMVVSFDSSQKVYLTFFNNKKAEPLRQGDDNLCSSMPGNVAIEVYRAVRFRHVYNAIEIPTLPVEKAIARVKQINLEKKQVTTTKPIHYGVLPGVEETDIFITITNAINPGHFWARKIDNSTTDIMEDLKNSLQKNKLKPIQGAEIGNYYASYLNNDNYLYRVRCDRIITVSNQNFVDIFFIDIGLFKQVSESSLYSIPESLLNYSGQAFECVLTEIQPSLLLNSRALWVEEACNLFSQCTKNKNRAKIYSVVQGIVSLELWTREISSSYSKPSSRFQNSVEININQLLIKKGFAQHVDEGFLSKRNHDFRENQLNMEPEERNSCNELQREYAVNLRMIDDDIKSPLPSECRHRLVLKGPFSPLETKVYSVAVSGTRPSLVNIDRDSVNAVLIDPEPQDPHERLLVATFIATNSAQNSLTLRHTNLMPNIHGFPALMALLFCPTAELRTNNEGTKYSSVLCGLGFDPNTGKALFRDHDIFMTIDTELSVDDIKLINSIRFYINCAIYLDDQTEPVLNTTNFTKCQRNVLAKLLSLLQTQRANVEESANHVNVKWNSLNKLSMLAPIERDINPHSIYSLHKAIDLKYHKQIVDLQSYHNNLNMISKRIRPFPDTEIICKICVSDNLISNLNDLRIHLISLTHKNNCEKIGIK